MKAVKLCTITAEELPELFDRTPEVKQEMLCEYREIAEKIRILKIDLDAVGAEIADLLVTGAPVRSGNLTATLVNGCLVVDDRKEDGAPKKPIKCGKKSKLED